MSTAWANRRTGRGGSVRSPAAATTCWRRPSYASADSCGRRVADDGGDLDLVDGPARSGPCSTAMRGQPLGSTRRLLSHAGSLPPTSSGIRSRSWTRRGIAAADQRAHLVGEAGRESGRRRLVGRRAPGEPARRPARTGHRRGARRPRGWPGPGTGPPSRAGPTRGSGSGAGPSSGPRRWSCRPPRGAPAARRGAKLRRARSARDAVVDTQQQIGITFRHCDQLPSTFSALISISVQRSTRAKTRSRTSAWSSRRSHGLISAFVFLHT